jgi:cytolethal distending toxin subunit A
MSGLSVGTRVLAATVTAIAAAALVPAAPAQADPAIPFLRGFQLFNMQSGKCLAPGGGGAAVQSTCREEAAHLWRLRLVSLTGLFQVQNVRSGRCLSAPGGAGRAVQSRCDDGLAHRWRLWDAKGKGFLIRSAVSARCLTVAGGGRAEDAAVVVSSCGPARSRRWDARLLGSTENG